MILSICKIYTNQSYGGMCNRVKVIKGCTIIATCMLCTSILYGVLFGDVTMKANVDVKTQDNQVKTMEESIVKTIYVRDEHNNVITSIAKVYPSVHMEISEDQVGNKTAEVLLELSKERILEVAKETSEQQPLKLHIECPSDFIMECMKNTEINHVTLTIQIPDEIIKKRNILLEEIMLRQGVIETLIKSEKSITIRIVGDDKIERYAWFIDGNQQDEQATKVMDLNLMIRVRTANAVESDIIEQLRGEMHGKKEYFLIDFLQSGVLPVQARINIALDYIILVNQGDQVKYVTYNVKDHMKVDVNGQISLQVTKGKIYIFEIMQ